MKTKTLTLVDRRVAARVLGISLRHFANLEGEGAITPKRRGRGGRPSLYELEELVPRYMERVTAAPATSTERAARTRRDTATARMTELKIARELRELLPRQQVVDDGQKYTHAWRAMVLRLPHRIVQECSINEEQRRKVHQLCRELLEEIASWKTAADLEPVIAEVPEALEEVTA